MTNARKILLCSTPVAGHVNPAAPIAAELVRRGHDVAWYTGVLHKDTVERTGAIFEPISAATDPAGRTPDEILPGRVGRTGLDGLKFDLKHLFLDEIPGQIRDLQAILDRFPADLVLADPGFMAAATLHELGGPRFATYGISILPMPSRDVPPVGSGKPPLRGMRKVVHRVLLPLVPRLMFGDVQKHYRQVRSRIGLPPTRSSFLELCASPFLYLQGSAAEFEFPRSDLPPSVQFVGPLLPDLGGRRALPAWWDDLDDGRPIVLVNQGTIATDPSDLVEPALVGLALEDVTVVATGGTGKAGVTGPIPANARVEEFVPFGDLLPRVDVMVTNGGYGGVQFALANGVPLVVAGATEEKPDIAARVVWSGVGVDLSTHRPTPEQVRDGVRTVLNDSGFRERARRFQQLAAESDAPRAAADLVEALLR